MMQIGAFSISSGYLRWRSRSARFAFPYITMSGMSLPRAAGNLPLAHDIAATNLCGTDATASSRFADHFTLLKAVLPRHPQSLMRSLVFLLRLSRFNMLSVSSSHVVTPNKSLEPTAGRRVAPI
jgi:hypothetical protein